MKYRVVLGDQDLEKWPGADGHVLDTAALTFGQIVQAEREMTSAPSVALIVNIGIPTYSAWGLRGAAWLARWQNDCAPPWEEFEPNILDIVVLPEPEGADVDPPAPSGASSPAPRKRSSRPRKSPRS